MLSLCWVLVMVQSETWIREPSAPPPGSREQSRHAVVRTDEWPLPAAQRPAATSGLPPRTGDRPPAMCDAELQTAVAVAKSGDAGRFTAHAPASSGIAVPSIVQRPRRVDRSELKTGGQPAPNGDVELPIDPKVVSIGEDVLTIAAPGAASVVNGVAFGERPLDFDYRQTLSRRFGPEAQQATAPVEHRAAD
jgi:hypothetical protein